MTPADLIAAQQLQPRHRPPLDPDFLAPILWQQAYGKLVEQNTQSTALTVALQQPNGETRHHRTRLLPHEEPFLALNFAFVERLLKFLLWAQGGSRIYLTAPASLVAQLQATYATGGTREFDAEFLGKKIYLEPFEIIGCSEAELPAENTKAMAAGGYLDGCRVGFDLGGSDRKAAAVQDGKVVFSEEIKWDPYFESNPNYHYDGVMESLRRAAQHLPQVDAIGGSAAGVYVEDEPRVASLFRGVPEELFADQVRPLFKRIAAEWNVPLTVVNDGDVTALAAAQMLGEQRQGGVLGLAFGTSLAAGYVSPQGHLMPWLNELAFVPVDYRNVQEGGHVDEWSGDAGTGVRYFSQQALQQLAPAAGFDFGDLPLPQQLVEVQAAMAAGDTRAESIYRSYGVYLGYTLPLFAQHYDFRHVLVLGRVLSGPGGDLILDVAKEVLRDEFPELAERLDFITPDEKFKRHGQSIAAASLPALA